MRELNAFVVDTRFDGEILKAIDSFVCMRPEVRSEMRQAALETSAGFTVTKAILSELGIFQQLATAN